MQQTPAWGEDSLPLLAAALAPGPVMGMRSQLQRVREEDSGQHNRREEVF